MMLLIMMIIMMMIIVMFNMMMIMMTTVGNVLVSKAAYNSGLDFTHYHANYECTKIYYRYTLPTNQKNNKVN